MDIKIRDFEITIIKSLRNVSSSFWDTLMQIITVFGEKSVIVGVLAIIYFLYDKEIGRKIAYTLFTSLLLNNSLKGLVKYPRPFKYDSTIKAVRTETATGYSFPSGHTQSATTLYSSIAFNCHLDKKLKVSNKLIWFIAIIIILLVSFSRIYLGVHYPKDVIVGIILGFCSTFICSFIFDYVKDSYTKELSVYLITLLIFMPFLTIFYTDKSIVNNLRDFYISYALLFGYTISFMIDQKWVNFTCNTSFKKKLIRLAGAAILYLIIGIGLKYVFPANNVFFDFIRYFLVTFIIMGIYPLVFRKNLFKD